MQEPLGQMRHGIMIANRRNGNVEGVYVGRPSVLGNPYTVGKDGTRKEVVDKYRHWLRQQYKKDGEVKNLLRKLARQVIERRTLNLVCWCAPHLCHAEVIRDALVGIIKQGAGK